MRTFKTSARFSARNGSVLALLLGGFIYSQSAVAACGWTGSGIAASSPTRGNGTIQTTGFSNSLANKVWYENSRYGAGSEMSVVRISPITGQGCQGLTELRNDSAVAVYEPPAGATPVGAGWRIPTTASGVAVEVYINNGSPHPSGGVRLGPGANVDADGNASAHSTLPSAITLKLVKTGDFHPSSGPINVTGGLGRFRYYSESDPAQVAAAFDELVFPAGYSSEQLFGSAIAPSCDVREIGALSLEGGSKTVNLLPVSANDFTGIGPIDKSAQEGQFIFHCSGVEETSPKVVFSALYPHNNGVDGVGMADVSSTVGVQVLLNDVPVRFETKSAALAWTRNTLPNKGLANEYSATGTYCKADCGSDTSGANWKDGEGRQGDNRGLGNAKITFKYYQTTAAKPDAGSFSVPFTVTIHVQ